MLDPRDHPERALRLRGSNQVMSSAGGGQHRLRLEPRLLAVGVDELERSLGPHPQILRPRWMLTDERHGKSPKGGIACRTAR